MASEELIAYFGYGSLVNTRTLQTRYLALIPARLKGWRRHWQARGTLATNTDNRLAGVEGSRHSAEQTAWRSAIGRAGFESSIAPQDLALLSVHRDANCTIGGMLVIDRLENLPGLDERERLYDRVSILPQDIETDSSERVFEQFKPGNLFLYVGQSAPPGKPPLLQSYLDTVMAGFLDVHGESGLLAFVASTVGFQREIIQDRETPIYPRVIGIDAGLARRFDEILAEAGVRFT